MDALLPFTGIAPYRHSAITSDSDYLPEFALRKKVRWCMNSKQPSRYIKTRRGNDLKQKILAQNGILTEVESKPEPTIADCARCFFVNPFETKYCSSCGYPLSVAAYDEIKEQENSRFRALEERFDEMQAMLDNLVTGLKNISDQDTLTAVAKSLYPSTILKIAEK